MRSFTVGDIIKRARRYADMEFTGFISPEEALDYFNTTYPELYDILVGVNELYFAEEALLTIQPNEHSYALPENFYKMLSVNYQNAANQWITLRPYELAMENGYGIVSANAAGTLRLRYVPEPPIYTDLTDEINGYSGWDDYVAVSMAIAMLDKEESSSAPLQKRQARLYDRITSIAQNRDQGMSHTMVDTYRINPYYFYLNYRYLIRGNEISVISTDYASPGMW